MPTGAPAIDLEMRKPRTSLPINKLDCITKSDLTVKPFSLLLLFGELSCFVPFPIIYRLASTERCLVFDRDQQFVFCILFSCFCKVLLLIGAFLVGSEEKSLIQYITRFFYALHLLFFVYFLEMPLSIVCTTLINNKPKSCLWLLRVKHPAMLPVGVRVIYLW